MDLKSTAVLKSVTVDGELVFKDQDAQFNVEWIKVKANGKLLIGSESCPITSQITFTFYGTRHTGSDMGVDPADDMVLGSKGLAALTNSHIEIHGQVNSKRLTWTRLSSTAQKGTDKITLEDSVAGMWQVGDTLLVTNTDYHPMQRWDSGLPPSISFYNGRGVVPDQNEEVKIQAISGNVVTLATPLQYTHWGEGYERAEVGLLNRRIVFKSDDTGASDRYGGHFMIRAAKVAKFTGIELYHMGQSGIMGRYNLHFHMNGDMRGRDFYVKDSSFRQSFQRCVAIHDTKGILVQNNVAYDIYGHCYFLEDGGEIRNVFDRNLGVKIKSVDSEGGYQLIPSDRESTAFWITNPDNDFTGNVAVGAVFGFWYSLPDSPVGASAPHYSKNDPYIKPRLTPLGTFDGNVAHSNFENGLHVDDMLNEDETTSLNSYTPRVPPYNNDKGKTKELWELEMIDAHFKNFISYKNRQYGAWTRGGPLRLSNFILLDNQFGFNAVPGPSYFENSLIIGETDNAGIANLAGENGRSRPAQWSVDALIKGLDTYDNFGPQYARNITFRNFVTDETRPAGAIGNLNNGPFVHHTRNRYIGFKFENANKAYVVTKDVSGDNPFHMGIHDLDGAIVGKDANGVAGGWVVSNNDLMTHAACTAKPEWNSHSCPFFGESYVQLVISESNAGQTDRTSINGTDLRAAFSDVKQTKAYYHELGSQNKKIDLFGRYRPTENEFLLEGNLIARRGYTLRYLGNTPTGSKLNIRMDNAAIGDWIILAIPYPPSALPFTITSNRYGSDITPLTQVTKLSDVEYNTYFYDTASEHLYLKFENNRRNSWDEIYTERWGFVDYVFNGITVTVTASCTKCALNPKKVSIPAQVSAKEDSYKALLQPCQMPGTVSSSGSGVAYFYMLPDRRELQLNIHHDLSETVTEVALLQGSPKGEQRTIDLLASKYSPIRTSVQLSHGEWTALVKGQLYFKVATTKNPKGELLGRIMCSDSSCSVPPSIPTLATACTIPRASYLKIYEEGSDITGWPDWDMYTSVWPEGEVSPVVNKSSIEQPLCGSSSMKIVMQYGEVALYHHEPTATTSVPEVNPSKYDAFEFFVKTAEGEAQIYFGWRYMNTDDKAEIQVKPKYISNFKIDSTAWSRVRVPLADLGITVTRQLKGFWIGLSDRTKQRTLYLDNLRFINSKQYDDPKGSGVSSSSVVKFKSGCGGGNSSGSLWSHYSVLVFAFLFLVQLLL